MLLQTMPLPGAANANPIDPAVRLIEPSPRPPATAIERLAMIALRHENPIALSSLVKNVARALYSEEMASGGSVLEIGLLGVDLFVYDVAVEVNSANGVLWQIESSQ